MEGTLEDIAGQRTLQQTFKMISLNLWEQVKSYLICSAQEGTEKSII